MKDMLEDFVPEKYYINTPNAVALINDLVLSGKLEKKTSSAVRTGGEEV